MMLSAVKTVKHDLKNLGDPLCGHSMLALQKMVCAQASQVRGVFSIFSMCAFVIVVRQNKRFCMRM